MLNHNLYLAIEISNRDCIKDCKRNLDAFQAFIDKNALTDIVNDHFSKNHLFLLRKFSIIILLNKSNRLLVYKMQNYEKIIQAQVNS